MTEAEQHMRTFQAILEQARQAVDAGELELSAVACLVAAHWAWFRPTGELYSLTLESVLAEVARKTPELNGEPKSAGRTGTLHVLSEALEVGGHTRLAWRWIENADEPCAVILTDQSGRAVPRRLLDGVERHGGELIDLSDQSLIRRAVALRRIAAAFERVVLHVHPFDVVPILAFQNHPVPVVFLNHADHVFWIGSSISNVIANIRDSGSKVCTTLRAVPEKHTFSLPLPLEATPAGHAGASVTAEPVLISVASSYKYGASPHLDFFEALEAVVTRSPSLRVMVVGPEQTGRWSDLHRTSNGRVAALGVRRDASTLLTHSLLYLDSYPFASLTSALEAAQHGLPVVSLRPAPGAEVFGLDDPALDAHMTIVDTVVQLAEVVANYVEFPERARQDGQRLRDEVAARHTMPGWGENLCALYRLCDQRPQIGIHGRPATSLASSEMTAMLIDTQRRVGHATLLKMWSRHGTHLTAIQRMKVARRLVAQGEPQAAFLLLPPRLQTRIKQHLTGRNH